MRTHSVTKASIIVCSAVRRILGGVSYTPHEVCSAVSITESKRPATLPHEQIVPLDFNANSPFEQQKTRV